MTIYLHLKYIHVHVHVGCGYNCGYYIHVYLATIQLLFSCYSATLLTFSNVSFSSIRSKVIHQISTLASEERQMLMLILMVELRWTMMLMHVVVVVVEDSAFHYLKYVPTHISDSVCFVP